jgi:rare lipoprotein A
MKQKKINVIILCLLFFSYMQLAAQVAPSNDSTIIDSVATKIELIADSVTKKNDAKAGLKTEKISNSEVYEPIKGGSKNKLKGTASFYSNKFEGRKTANGEIFSQKKMTCACNVLPLGTWIKVTNTKNNKSVTVKVNDRLHPRMSRIVDLTRAAAVQLNFIDAGLANVTVQVLGKKRK